MTDDSTETKIVGLDGLPVSRLDSDTSAQILECVDAFRSIVSGEKHVAVGMFTVDAMGRVWTNFLIESEGALSVGAATLLQKRIIDAYEARR